MVCHICGNELTGLQREACSRPCRIKLDGIKRREAGRLRKANMSAEKYARLQAQKKADAAKRRAEGRTKISWACVTCSKNFEVKLYSRAGYWCSDRCRESYWRMGLEPSKSTALVIRPKKRPENRVTVIKGGWWTAGNCEICNESFVSPHRAKTCSPPCQRKLARKYNDWIAPRTRTSLYERDGWTCHLCNEPVPQDLEYSHDTYNPLYPSLDHIVPRSHGGTDEPSNLKLAHVECNRRRGTTSLAQLEDHNLTPQ